jgi:membrane-associated protein
MAIISTAIDFILHIDRYLGLLVERFGIGIYGILFLIVFIETGLVVMPLLPGDSLLFVSGTFAANGIMDITTLTAVFIIAAILGDTANYCIGSYFGKRLQKSKWVKKEYMEKTHAFFEKHGPKTIILARFAPIIRTFAPFIAGIGKMQYRKFLLYNIVGAVAWVALFLYAGYFFGKVQFVEENLTAITYGIIVVSLLPALFEYLKHRG